MKKIAIVLILFLFSSVNIYACSCMEIQMPLHKKIKGSFTDSDVIFMGKVVDIKGVNAVLPHKSSSDPIIYTFEIINKIKGETKNHTIEIISARSGASCGYSFQLGESYLVYSSVSDDFSLKTGIKSSFVTSLCRRNNRLSEVAKRELKILRRLSKIRK